MSKKSYKTDEDAPANSTGPSVVGTGDDVADWKKKKKKKKWDKYSPDALGRQFRMESTVAIEPNLIPDDTFAGVDVFNVNGDEFDNCKHGKKKHERWSNYVDIDSESGKRIYGYAKKNPNKSIIVQHDKTGHMLYLKKFEKGEEQ
jgi:hypothetical protein